MNVQQSSSAASEGRDEAPVRRRISAGDGPLAALVIALVSIALMIASYFELRDRAPDIDIAPVTVAPAAIAAPVAAARPPEYFPDGYVNRATEPERQYETF